MAKLLISNVGQLKRADLRCLPWPKTPCQKPSELTTSIEQIRLEWLKHWRRDCAKNLDKMQREFIGVATGTTCFTLTALKQKQFALLGLQYKGKHFNVPDEIKPRSSNSISRWSINS